jgi:hypothetical protein
MATVVRLKQADAKQADAKQDDVKQAAEPAAAAEQSTTEQATTEPAAELMAEVCRAAERYFRSRQDAGKVDARNVLMARKTDLQRGLDALAAAGVDGMATAAIRRDMASVDAEIAALDLAGGGNIADRVAAIATMVRIVGEPGWKVSRARGPRAAGTPRGSGSGTQARYRVVVDGRERAGNDASSISILSAHTHRIPAADLAAAFAAQNGGMSLASHLMPAASPTMRKVTLKCPDGHDHTFEFTPLLKQS